MIKKTIACAAAFAFIAGFTVTGPAMADNEPADNGPAEMTLQATVDAAKKAKPAIFPHKKHQDIELECGACHHGQDANGKQTAYVEGMKIEKCESCHNKTSGISAKAEDGKTKIGTFKDAAHANCKGCHKAIEDEKKRKELKKCTTCHPKKDKKDEKDEKE